MDKNKKAIHESDLTQGSIKKEIWDIAWPMMLSVFFYTLYNLVDTYWVSKLSDEAIAAVSISQITLFIMISLGFGITAGSGVIMAMHIGAKNITQAKRVLGQSFVLSALLAVFFTVTSLAFRNELLIASGAKGLIFKPAMEYFIIVSSGSVLLFIMMAIIFAFNAQGDTHTLTKLFAVSTLINVVLDPIMIFGWYGFPKLGIAGAAIATLVSQSVFIIIAIRSLSRIERQIRFEFKNLVFEWASVKKVLNIGFPAALTQVIFPIGLAILTFIISKGFQEAGAVAFSLGFRIEFFAYLPAAGFGFAAMAMIGQNIGAAKLERAKESFAKAIAYGFWAATALGILAALFSSSIIGIFTQETKITEYASSYFCSVTLSYGFLAAMMVEANSFQAIGRSWPGFWIFLLRVFIVTVPISYISTQVYSLSITSIWNAVIAGNLAASIIRYFWIKNAINKIVLSGTPVHAPI